MHAQTYSQSELEEAILAIVRDGNGLDERFAKTTPLTEIGLDSLALVRILVGIDQKLGVWVESDSLTPENLLDVEHLAACVSRHIGKQ